MKTSSKKNPENQMKNLVLQLIVCTAILTNFALAHDISGIINDAEDYETSNGKIITLWNPANGIQDNITDIIGPSGNSGYTKTYLLDCEQLSSPCQENDILYIKVLPEQNDNYATPTIQIQVTSNNTDFADTTQLNSPPQISITSPTTSFAYSQSQTTIACLYEDADTSDTAQVTLFANFSGTTQEISSQSNSQTTTYFPQTLSEGFYSYYCTANDSLATTSTQTQYLTVDITPPIISSLSLNATSSCGATTLNITCEASDETNLSQVTIQATSPTTSTNYSTTQAAQNVFTKILALSETGTWNFTCYATDAASNAESSTPQNFYLYSSEPALEISSLQFSDNTPSEKQNITITATIENNGCSQSSTSSLEFFEGDPQGSGTLVSTETIPQIQNLSSEQVATYYITKIGETQIYVSINEDYENTTSKELDVDMWQYLYGDIEATKVLTTSTFSGISSWNINANFAGNIFITDQESQIDWLNLTAIQFSNLDSIDQFLGTQTYDDSIATIFDQASEENFTIHNYNISSVLTIQSTNNDNFKTGILFDSSDDTDGGYAGADQEDILFVSKINSNVTGEYGIYDYEIRVPAKLREYHTTNTEYVYFYYDLT